MNGWAATQIDYLIFLGGVVAMWAGLLGWLHRTQRLSALPRITGVLMAVILIGGWFAVDRADQASQRSLKDRVQVMLPHYVQEFEQLGHALVRDDAASDDPLYLELINTQIRWLKLNPFVADIYTMRRRADGALFFVIDSETDYNHNGRYDEPREERTPIGEVYDIATEPFERALAGELVFDPNVVTDRWGTWVSAFAPLRDPNGQIEAVLGIDLDASEWLTQRARARGVWLWSLGGIVILLSAAMVIIALQRHELRERRRTEAQLREQGQLRKMIFDQAPGGVALAELDYRLVEVNEAFCRIVGYSRQELLRMTIFQITHPEDQDLTSKQHKLVGSGQHDSAEIEKRYVRKDGASIHVMVRVGLVRDDQGAPRYLVGQVTDISERRRAEQELRARQHQLSTILTNTPIILYAVDERGVFTLCEGAGLSPLGLQPSECVGKSVFDLYAHRPDILSDIRRGLAGETTTSQREIQNCVFEMRGTPLLDAARNVVGVISIAFDITHRVQANREREKMERKLLEVQKLESLGVLAGGVAHDFNNLLTTILGHANFVRLGLPENSAALPSLQQIEQASQTAANLCQQLLAYAGRRRLDTTTLDLNALVRETTDLLRVSVGAHARLEFNLAADLPLIAADTMQVRQVILNLVLNAAEAIGRREGLIQVSTRLQPIDPAWLAEARTGQELPAGNYVCLEVRDTGPGMDAAVQARVFDPFFSTKGSGRGLGLAAALGIMRSHQGALRLSSKVGEGARLTLCFPLAAGVLAEKNTANTNRNWRGSGTVLIVDDEQPVRMVTAQMIAYYGFEVRQAASGQAAVDIFRETGKRFDLVLLDLTMPGMDGYETFNAIRQLQPEQRIVIFSGYSAQDARQRFAGQNIAGFLQKPFSAETLRGILNQISA